MDYRQAIRDLWTTPNKLSVSRFPLALLIPLCAVSGWWLTALVFDLWGFASDRLDGWWARKRNAWTFSGERFWDPAGDLMHAVGKIAGLVFTGLMSWWWVLYLTIGLIIVWAPAVLKPVKRTRWFSFTIGSVGHWVVQFFLTWEYLVQAGLSPLLVIFILFFLAPMGARAVYQVGRRDYQ
jgi:phosphatidylglycerophosphate synthase